MDIRELLIQDHQEALQLAERIERSDDPAEAEQLFVQLREAIVKHSRGEERILYPALEDSGDEEAAEMAREAAVEHELVDLLFDRMTRMRSGSDNWKARASVVKELLEHHVEEEQEEVFPRMDALFDEQELQQMGERFRTYKERFRMPAAAGGRAPRAGQTGTRH
ncbi:MAG TPA: hemerythrin domain-containing protein [Burkholderiaceae bacterium]|nr:hemerythrin domain-containing protein [Burkholderiaceae bacterium]